MRKSLNSFNTNITAAFRCTLLIPTTDRLLFLHTVFYYVLVCWLLIGCWWYYSGMTHWCSDPFVFSFPEITCHRLGFLSLDVSRIDFSLYSWQTSVDVVVHTQSIQTLSIPSWQHKTRILGAVSFSQSSLRWAHKASTWQTVKNWWSCSGVVVWQLVHLIFLTSH